MQEGVGGERHAMNINVHTIKICDELKNNMLLNLVGYYLISAWFVIEWIQREKKNSEHSCPAGCCLQPAKENQTFV